MLSGLLSSLENLDKSAGTYAIAAIVVVDNDEAGSAQQVVTRFQQSSPLCIIYDRVSERNIAVARNRGVEIALGLDVDYVAFIDDDSTASAEWLTELVRASAQYNADIVWGRLSPSFETGVASWVVKGGFYGQPSQPTGTPTHHAESNNALVRASVLQSFDPPFDASLGRSGGSDSLFFRNARLAGATIVWSDEAVVAEKIQRSRATVRWILQRAFRIGNCGVFVMRDALPGFKTVAVRAIKGFGHIAVGLVSLPFALPRGRSAVVRSLARCALGIGAISALLGYRYIEYRKVHGS